MIDHTAEQEKKNAKAKNDTVYRQEKNSPVDCKKQNNSEQQEKQGQNDEAKKIILPFCKQHTTLIKANK